MSAPDNSIAPPNPTTPLAFLDPVGAYQTTVELYCVAALLGIYIWDILDNISHEYRTIFRTHFRLSTVAYVGSRVGCLGYILTTVVFTTAPIGHCERFEKITDAFYPLSLGFTTLLFFFRLRAIYNRNRLIVGLFFFLWCALIGSTCIIPGTITGGNIAITDYCVDTYIPNAAFVGVYAPLVYDTLVYVAISWRLAQNAYIEANFKEKVQVVMFGKYLPIFSKALMLDGQRYYLIALSINLFTVIVYTDTSKTNHVPVSLRSIGIPSNIVLTGIMACRIYRKSKAGVIREEEISSSVVYEKKYQVMGRSGDIEHQPT